MHHGYWGWTPLTTEKEKAKRLQREHSKNVYCLMQQHNAFLNMIMRHC